MTRIWNHLFILGLTGLALFFCSGCTFDFFALATGYDPELKIRYVVRCEPQTQRLELYEQQMEKDAIPGSPFGVREIPIGSPINGKPCSVSTEDQNRPFTTGEALNKGLLAGSGPSGSRHAADRAAGSSSSLNDFYQL